MEGILIPRAVVQAMIKEIDPDGAAVGKKNNFIQILLGTLTATTNWSHGASLITEELMDLAEGCFG